MIVFPYFSPMDRDGNPSLFFQTFCRYRSFLAFFKIKIKKKTIYRRNPTMRCVVYRFNNYKEKLLLVQKSSVNTI